MAKMSYNISQIPNWLKTSDLYESLVEENGQNEEDSEIQILSELIIDEPLFNSDDEIIKTMNVITFWGVHEIPNEMIEYLYNWENLKEENKEEGKEWIDLKEYKTLDVILYELEKFKKLLNISKYFPSYGKIYLNQNIAKLVRKYPYLLTILENEAPDSAILVVTYNGNIEKLRYYIEIEANKYIYLDKELFLIAISSENYDIFEYVKNKTKVTEINCEEIKNIRILNKIIEESNMKTFNPILVFQSGSFEFTVKYLEMNKEKENELLEKLCLYIHKYKVSDIVKLIEKYPELVNSISRLNEDTFCNILLNSELDVVIFLENFINYDDIAFVSSSNNEEVFNYIFEKYGSDKTNSGWVTYSVFYKLDRMKKLIEIGYEININECLNVALDNFSDSIVIYLIENYRDYINFKEIEINHYYRTDLSYNTIKFLQYNGVEISENRYQTYNFEENNSIFRRITSAISERKYNLARELIRDITIKEIRNYEVMRFYLENTEGKHKGDEIFYHAIRSFNYHDLLILIMFKDKFIIKYNLLRFAVLENNMENIIFLLRYGFEFDSFCLKIAENNEKLSNYIKSTGYKQSEDDNNVISFLLSPRNFYFGENYDGMDY